MCFVQRAKTSLLRYEHTIPSAYHTLITTPTEERPSCMRCLDDGRSCEYVLRLIWKDESSRRGVTHGRGKHAEVSFADPTPSEDLVEKAEWQRPQVQHRYFLNTVRRDIDGTRVQPLTRFHRLYRRVPALRVYNTLQNLGLSRADGMFFQYCECISREYVINRRRTHTVQISLMSAKLLHLSMMPPTAIAGSYSLCLYPTNVL